MVLLLFYVPPIFVGVLCWSLFWYALLHALSSFAIILTRKKELVVFACIVFWMSCYCKCSVALPQGAVFFSAVFDCGISRSYSFTFKHGLLQN